MIPNTGKDRVICPYPHIAFILAVFVFAGCEDSRPCVSSGPGRSRVVIAGDTTTVRAGNFSYSTCHPTENSRYRWSSSDSDVVTVDQKGVVHALSAGRARISIEEKGRQQGESKQRSGVPVRVIPRVNSMVLQPSRTHAAIGDTIGPYDLTAYDSSGQVIKNVPTLALIGKTDSVLRNARGARFLAISPGTTTVTAQGIINREVRATVVVKDSSSASDSW